jgi:hypothetical protein
MKRFIASLFLAASSFGLLTIVQHDALTGTYAAIKDGSIEPRVRAAYTNVRTGEFPLAGYSRDLDILQTKYTWAFECAKGLRTDCKSKNTK